MFVCLQTGGLLILKQDLEKILGEYLIAKREIGTTIAPIAKFINNQFFDHIKSNIDNSKMYVLTSAGVGSLANIPWASVTFNHYRGQDLGLDVDYFFKSDMSGVYLSFKIFYFDELKEEYGSSFDNFIENRAVSIRDFLKYKNLLSDDFIYDVDLVNDGKYSKIFSTGTIIAKYYDSNNIPSDDELLKDFNQFLHIYEIVDKEYNGLSIEYLEKKDKVENMGEKTFNYNSFYEYLLAKGYLFNKKTIENYLLSLKVKPFAILTGNSGTGKTKLSQLFAKYISGIEENDLEDDEYSASDGYITVKAKTNYSSWANKGWTLNSDDFREFLPFKEISKKIDFTVDGIEGRGTVTFLIQLYYDSEILKNYFNTLYEKDETNVVPLKIKCEDIKAYGNDSYLENNDPIILKQNSNKSAFNKRQWMLAKKFFDYLPLPHGFKNCNILVKDTESTARFRVLSKLTFEPNKKLQGYLKRKDGKEVTLEIKPNSFDFSNFNSKLNCDKKVEEKDIGLYNKENYKIIPVGANWTENRHIVGYYNVITNSYQSSPAYDLIQDANKSSDAHFLILDEMNLSHVERYFADFLSSIESGEKIPLYGEEELNLPSNLFIIGTVNVDETTYMFSPKVLDRANVIEFDTISASSYMNNELSLDAPSGDISFLENPLEGTYIRDYGIDELRDIFSDVSFVDESFWNILTNEIDAFQMILKLSGFDFGFRVINEILRFMAVAWIYEGRPSEFSNWNRYFDACIKQKMLPKLHGSEKIIGETLDELYNKCVDGHVTYDESKYPESARKLAEMRDVLRKQRYVSFIN